MTEEDNKKNVEKDNEKKELTEEEQEKLREQINELQKKLDQLAENRVKKRRIIAIEFGSAFHSNPVLNVLAYFMLNLTVIYGIIKILGFGNFTNDISAVLFVLIYTLIESLFRMYILMNHFQLVMRSLGFIFYFGYLSIFYIVDIYIFPDSVAFINETLFVVFVGMFVVFRYLISQLIKNFIFGQSWL